jgi:glycyl-tRNA synthetase (class II)
MNKIAKLENFCFKTGILIKSNKNSSPLFDDKYNKYDQYSNFHNKNNKEESFNFGPYGQLLLNQIRNEWLKSNLFKFENNFLIDSQNFAAASSDMNQYVSSLINVFNIKSLPVGFINVYNQQVSSKANPFLLYDLFKNHNKASSEKFFKSSISSDFQTTHLNCFYFCDNNLFKHESGDQKTLHLKSFKDPFTFFQREKKNWWIKILNNPENLTINHIESDLSKTESINEFDLNYKVEETTETSWLENIKHIRNVNDNKYLKLLIGSSDIDNFLLKETKQLIITQTNCNNILKNIIIDSVQILDSNKFIFNLDYRLAPFKTCIIFEQNINSSMSSIANDLRKKLFSFQVNSFKMEVANENELNKAYEHLDEMGVPFNIYLPSSITKNGICFVRNRDTSLSEQTHIDRIANYFNQITNSLTY